MGVITECECGVLHEITSFLHLNFSRRCKPVRYSGEGVGVNVRLHWIVHGAKGRVSRQGAMAGKWDDGISEPISCIDTTVGASRWDIVGRGCG